MLIFAKLDGISIAIFQLALLHTPCIATFAAPQTHMKDIKKWETRHLGPT
jgi:hypothetical protein